MVGLIFQGNRKPKGSIFQVRITNIGHHSRADVLKKQVPYQKTSQRRPIPSTTLFFGIIPSQLPEFLRSPTELQDRSGNLNVRKSPLPFLFW